MKAKPNLKSHVSKKNPRELVATYYTILVYIILSLSLSSMATQIWHIIKYNTVIMIGKLTIFWKNGSIKVERVIKNLKVEESLGAYSLQMTL